MRLYVDVITLFCVRRALQNLAIMCTVQLTESETTNNVKGLADFIGDVNVVDSRQYCEVFKYLSILFKYLGHDLKALFTHYYNFSI